MMASIKFDDGKEVTLSKETTERLRKELLNNVPNYVCVGQIYRINNSEYMVASLGTDGGVGITVVGSGTAGCYSSGVLSGTCSHDKLRDLLMRKNAEYLGKFNKVFKTI